MVSPLQFLSPVKPVQSLPWTGNGVAQPGYRRGTYPRSVSSLSFWKCETNRKIWMDNNMKGCRRRHPMLPVPVAIPFDQLWDNAKNIIVIVAISKCIIILNNNAPRMDRSCLYIHVSSGTHYYCNADSKRGIMGARGILSFQIRRLIICRRPRKTVAVSVAFCFRYWIWISVSSPPDFIWVHY